MHINISDNYLHKIYVKVLILATAVQNDQYFIYTSDLVDNYDNHMYWSSEHWLDILKFTQGHTQKFSKGCFLN